MENPAKAVSRGNHFPSFKWLAVRTTKNKIKNTLVAGEQTGAIRTAQARHKRERLRGCCLSSVSPVCVSMAAMAPLYLVLITLHTGCNPSTHIN